ncbi:MAG: hypothetical protein ICV68_03035 [Pyrinomonadaceae bacterium]|nr:hypothetical protein [Pyrinomonadaceae bacterium]
MKEALLKSNQHSFISHPSAFILILLLACAHIFCGAALAQTSGSRKSGDPRVRTQLDQLGYKYELTTDGDFKLIPIKTEDGRSQLVYVYSNTQQYSTLEIREVMSPAYLSTGPLSAAVANRLLRENSEVKFGAWRVEPHSNGQKYLALFAVQISATSDTETLRLAIKSVLLVADRMEKELTGTDDY